MINDETAKKIVEKFLAVPAHLEQGERLILQNNEITRLNKLLSELRLNYQSVRACKRIKTVDPFSREYSSALDTSISLSTDHSSEKFYTSLFAKSINKKIIKISSQHKQRVKIYFDARTQFLISLYTLHVEQTGFRASRQSKKVLKRALMQQLRALLK